MRRRRAYSGMMRVGFRTPWMYRGDRLIGFVSIALRTVLFTSVWRAVYKNQGSVSGVDQRTAVGYAVLALGITAVLNPWPGASIAKRVRLSLIGIDLLRPYSLATQSLSYQLGNAAAQFPHVIVGLAVGYLLGGLVAPDGSLAAIGFVASLILAIIVGQLLTLIVSSVAFWTMETGGVMITYMAISTFLAGGLVPLWLMPDWLRALASWLPFQVIVFTPLSIYMGQPRGSTREALAVQLVWAVVLAVAAAWVMSRAKYRIVVQGG